MGVRAKEIIDGLLYMSSTPAKWTPRDERDRWLSDHVDHVVALCRRDPEIPKLVAPTTGHYVSDDEVLANGDPEDLVQVHHYPVVDSHKTVDQRIPDVVVPNVLEWISSGSPVLVSCLAGRSRSGICCGLVLREWHDLTGEGALRLLRERRPNAIKREGPAEWLRALPRPSDRDRKPPPPPLEQ